MPGDVTGVGPQRDIDILGDYWFASVNGVPGLLVFNDAGVLKAIYDQADGESALSYHVESMTSGYYYVEDGVFRDLEEIQELVDQAGVPLYEITVQVSAAGGDLVTAEAFIAGNSYDDNSNEPPFDLLIPQS